MDCRLHRLRATSKVQDFYTNLECRPKIPSHYFPVFDLDTPDHLDPSFRAFQIRFWQGLWFQKLRLRYWPMRLSIVGISPRCIDPRRDKIESDRCNWLVHGAYDLPKQSLFRIHQCLWMLKSDAQPREPTRRCCRWHQWSIESILDLHCPTTMLLP